MGLLLPGQAGARPRDHAAVAAIAEIVARAFMMARGRNKWKQARATRQPRPPTAAESDGLSVAAAAFWILFGSWLGDLDSNQDCSVQSREFYR
jgi:anti-sigma factor RsiW